MSESENSSEPNYDWLTESLFEPIVEAELRDNVHNDYELKLISITPAVGKGDNFVSLVTRVALQVNFINMNDRKSKTYNFIVKSCTVSIDDSEDLNEFKNEINFYEQIVPNFLKFDDSITFLPKCYSIITQGRQIIIMNDLLSMGFEMQDRLVGLDLEHCKIYYKFLARFHALSAAYCEQFGQYADCFHKPMYRLELKTTIDKWNDVMHTSFLQIFDRYDCLKPYREKFHKWKDGIFESICGIMEEKPDQFNVLNHGDSWVNNILFQHDEDHNPTGLCFVDFPNLVVGTPMIDILYFFATSPTLEVREHNFDDLLQIYQTSLTEYLTKYNYPKPIPTINDLQMMTSKHGLLLSIFLTDFVPFILLDPDNSQPYDSFANDDDKGRTLRCTLYNTPRYIKVLEVALKFLDRKGLLEV